MSLEANGRVLVTSLTADVEALLRQVAATKIMPRFQRLQDFDVIEKSPGELVTTADREAEAMLADVLASLLPQSRVVGEEAATSDTSLLDHHDQGLAWIVDPLDGTAHFAAGREPFGTMVALAADGVSLGSWIYNPVRDLMFTASAGGGAFVRDSRGVKSRLRTGDPTGIPIASLATQFMTPRLRAETLERAGRAFELRPIPRCAAEHYPRLCRRENHVALFQRTLPWDHAAGALLFAEAGGHLARWDGSTYRFYDSKLGILAATSSKLWDEAAEVLFSGSIPAVEGRQLLPPIDEA
jgi:fructose-1,6-bisphosphatase/inositol monophosphatase family enzyme